MPCASDSGEPNLEAISRDAVLNQCQSINGLRHYEARRLNWNLLAISLFCNNIVKRVGTRDERTFLVNYVVAVL